MAKRVCCECGEYGRHWGLGLCELCYRRAWARRRRAGLTDAERASEREAQRLRMAAYRERVRREK